MGRYTQPGVGTAIGYLIGRVVATASSAIFEQISGRTTQSEHEFAARMALGQMIEEQEQVISQRTAGVFSEHALLIASFQRRLASTKTQAEVETLAHAVHAEHLGIERPDTSDRSLMRGLLEDWVREHAGDEEDANRQTSETDWENARTEAFGEGDSLDGHHELFAYQTRRHLDSVGLPGAIGSHLVREVESVNNAEEAMESFDGRQLHFERAADRLVFGNLLSKNAGPNHRFTQAGWDQIDNGMHVVVVLDLTTADGACYVDAWEYRVEFDTDVLEPYQGALQRTRWVCFRTSPD